MARRTELVVIDAEGRDKGRRFHLTEMSADVGARWALRFILALTNANGELPDMELAHSGFAGVAKLMPGLFDALAKLDASTVQPLLDELMGCVQYVPEARGVPMQAIMKGDNCQIDEIGTFFTLYWKVLQLHVGFSLAADSPIPA